MSARLGAPTNIRKQDRATRRNADPERCYIHGATKYCSQEKQVELGEEELIQKR